MATIRVRRVGHIYTIQLEGHLGAADLRRLERACRFALEYELVPIELHLEHVLTIDEVARAYIDRLRARGARILGDPLRRHTGVSRAP